MIENLKYRLFVLNNWKLFNIGERSFDALIIDRFFTTRLRLYIWITSLLHFSIGFLNNSHWFHDHRIIYKTAWQQHGRLHLFWMTSVSTIFIFTLLSSSSSSSLSSNSSQIWFDNYFIAALWWSLLWCFSTMHKPYDPHPVAMAFCSLDFQ